MLVSKSPVQEQYVVSCLPPKVLKLLECSCQAVHLIDHVVTQKVYQKNTALNDNLVALLLFIQC